MNVKFVTKCGFRVETTDAHMGLIEWFMHLYPDKEEYWFSANEEKFVVQVIGGIEREFNVTPPHVLDDSLSHESQCKRLLLYLHEHGNIATLSFT